MAALAMDSSTDEQVIPRVLGGVGILSLVVCSYFIHRILPTSFEHGLQWYTFSFSKINLAMKYLSRQEQIFV